MPVPCQRFHILGLYQDRRKKASPKKKRVASQMNP